MSKNGLIKTKRSLHHRSHIIILVFQIDLVVPFIIDGIERFHPGFPLCAVLTENDGMRIIVDRISESLEMLVLTNYA